MAFLYTCDGQYKNEIQKTISSIRASTKMKHLGRNLTKDVENLYSENDKT